MYYIINILNHICVVFNHSRNNYFLYVNPFILFFSFARFTLKTGIYTKYEIYSKGKIIVI